MNTEMIRRILCALAFVGYTSWAFEVPAEASRQYDWCSVSCGETQSCALECENDGGGTITCGEYNDGPENSWCLEECSDVCSVDEACARECRQSGSAFDCETFNSGVCDNTCENVCSSMSSDGSESCQDDGAVSSTCEDYDKMVQCNDGVCAASEVCVCSECSAYCVIGDVTSALITAFTPLTFTEGEIGDACDASNLYEFADWECPDWSSVSGYENKDNPLCEEMNAMRQFYSDAYHNVKKWAEAIDADYSCVTNDQRTACRIMRDLEAAAAYYLGKFEYYNSKPCYVNT